MAYLILSPCASNDATIINGTGRSINVVMRIGREVVWAGEVGPSRNRDILYMHPGGTGAIDFEVTFPGSKQVTRGEFGYVVSYHGNEQIFLIDDQGIHHAGILPISFFDQAKSIAKTMTRQITTSIACP